MARSRGNEREMLMYILDNGSIYVDVLYIDPFADPYHVTVPITAVCYRGKALFTSVGHCRLLSGHNR